MKYLLLFSLILSFFKLSAQDIISTNDGKEIQVIVSEIGINEVKYKRFDNKEGPSYTILKSQIIKIKYKNGQIENFNNTSLSTPIQNNKEGILVKTNSVKYESLSNAFFVNDGNIPHKEMYSIFSNNPVALKHFKNGKREGKYFLLIPAGGVLFLGGLAFKGNEIDYGGITESNLASLGVVVSIIGIASGFYGLYHKKVHYRKAVFEYNKGISNKTSYNSTIDFGVMKSGNIGIVYSF